MLDLEDLNLEIGISKRAELDRERALLEQSLRIKYRQQGLEYKSNSIVLGGEAKDPMLYKIRKFVIFHIIDNPHLAKRGAFKSVWVDKYNHIVEYNNNITNTDISKDDRKEIIAKLKKAGLYKRTSFLRVGSIIRLIQDQYTQRMLRREVEELKDMLSMYLNGTGIVINNIAYKGDANYYYLPDKTGKIQRVRKGAFTKAFDVAIEYGLIESLNSYDLSNLVEFVE
jgi:hypothetical protein